MWVIKQNYKNQNLIYTIPKKSDKINLIISNLVIN